MIAGFDVKGDHGEYQLTDGGFYPSLTHKGRATLSDRPGRWNGATLRIPNAYMPMVALRPTFASDMDIQVFGTIRQWQDGNDTYVYIGGCSYYSSRPVQYMDYWVFDRPTPTVHGEGIQLFDETSLIRYDSSAAPLNVVSLGRVVVPDGKQYGVISQINVGLREEEINSFRDYAYSAEVRGPYHFKPNEIASGISSIAEGMGYLPQYLINMWEDYGKFTVTGVSMLVADVTGL